MIAYAFKQNGIYKALSEDGWLLGAWEFRNEKSAKDLISNWLAKDGYHVEFIQQYWTDDRVKDAKKRYELNYPGASFEGYALD